MKNLATGVALVTGLLAVSGLGVAGIATLGDNVKPVVPSQPRTVVERVEVPVPGPTETVEVPVPAPAKTVRETVTETRTVHPKPPAQPKPALTPKLPQCRYEGGSPDKQTCVFNGKVIEGKDQ